ncbi:sensor histidine kinase [Cohnella nanjingensis]|uniref:Histidine kinase n=1 Tax=Cohnella nanjingensis TaxID=1387779 RepID=A0A7X0VGK1_9BACL|nr:histidine kinase [Cohnella nanjingensis]MBB6671739.1 histidine kinase [Cohnella nanjingensis]
MDSNAAEALQQPRTDREGERRMDWIVKLIMNRKFFTKIFISISIVSFIGVFGMAFVYQRYFKEVLTNNEIYRVQRSIDQTALNLDNQLYRIVNNVHYFFEYSGNGNRLMATSTADGTSEARRDRTWAENALGAFRLQYSSELESVFFLLRDHADGDKETLFYDSELTPVPEMDYRAQSWYRDFIAGRSNFWSQPTEELLFFQDRSLKTIYLTLSRYDAQGRDGILVVRLNGKMFSDAFRLLATADLNLELRNAAGEIVYASPTSREDVDPVRDIRMESNLGQSGFQVQAHIKQTFIDQAVRKVRSIQPYIIVAIALITLFISLILSLSLVRPVKKLLRLMKKAELGDLDVRFNGKFADEVGILGNGFNRMLENMTQSIDKAHDAEMKKLNAEMKQKDATLLAMQNQINPHFLYNTLEVINCQAIIHEVPSVSRMSKALADFFRYSIGHPKAEVPLAVEAAHVRTYLDIQHERYPELEIDMDGLAAYGRYPIVKLTLQPIVENAFKYAFTGQRDYYLRLYAEDVDDRSYVIHVEDNGEGMEEERLLRMNELLQVAGEGSGAGEDAPSGIGLRNVQNRIRLRYGAPYGLNVQESMSGGVDVAILLPKRGNGDEDLDR